MISPSRLRFPAWLHGALLLLSLGWAHVPATAGADWPGGYVVAEDTTSPDERYGLLIPHEGAGDDSDVNFLEDLKEKRRLGPLKGFHYFEHQNHASLRATWSEDSRWCVAELGSRFGFAAIAVLELSGSGFTQADVGKHIQRSLDVVIARQARDKETSGDGYARFRLGPGRVLRVRATGSTNPKRFEDSPTFCAGFAGTFDLKTRRWLASSARGLGKKDYDATENAYAEFGDDDFLVLPEGKDPPGDFRGQVFRSEAQRAEKLDEILNDVYRIVRLTLPPARFAGVKAAQIAWLKRRDALGTDEEKAKETLARIKSLQDLLW